MTLICSVIVLTIILLLTIAPRHALPSPKVELLLANGVGTYSEISFPSTDSKDAVWTARVAHLFPGQYTFSIVDRADDDPPSSAWLESAAAAQNAVVAINGGYFDASRHPIGWRVIAGQQTSPPVHLPLYSGAFWCSADNVPHICWMQDLPPHPTYAIQSGPLIVEPNGQIGIHPPAGPAANRTVVAITPAGHALLITTTPVSLFQLAEALTQHPASFGVDRIDCAINFDGGPSTAMFAQSSNSIRRFPPAGPLRDALLILPEKASAQP